MANKVIKIGNTSSSSSSESEEQKSEVYKDVSIVSTFSGIKEPTISDEKYKLFVLLAEEHPNTLTKDLIVTEEVREYIKLYYGVDEQQFINDYNMFLLSGRFKIDKKTNVRAVQGAIHNIFTWIPGERILNPEFGSNLRKLLYEGITQFNVELIMAEIRHAVSVWEPRVLIELVVNVGSIDDTEDNTVHLEVEYTIPGLTLDQIYSEPIVYTRS